MGLTLGGGVRTACLLSPGLMPKSHWSPLLLVIKWAAFTSLSFNQIYPKGGIVWASPLSSHKE